MITLASFIEILFTPFIWGIAGTAFFGRTSSARPVPGLLFHSVHSKIHPLTLSTISVSQFKSIVYYLKSNGFVSITLGKVPSSAAAFPISRQLFLTFDDGCRSFYKHVLPIVEEINFKATIFPVAGYLGRSSSWDVLPHFLHLSKPEIMEISSLGHEIGSHGLTHADLTYLGTKDLSNELHDSKKILEDIIGKEVIAISFPFGSWNTRVWNLAQEIGYRCGTIYRRHRHKSRGLFPVYGVYSIDSPQNILARISPKYPTSLSVSCARIISHFAKGSPLWKFDKKYRL